MKDWIDCPVSNYRQCIEEAYWCRACKESYDVTLRFDNEVGEYAGDIACPLCEHDGVLWADRLDVDQADIE